MATGVKVLDQSSSRHADTCINEQQLDLKTAARYYGTTYDTFENKFRQIKKQANELKAAVDSGEAGEVPTPARTKSAPSTPRKPKTPKKDPLSCKCPSILMFDRY